MPTVWHSRTYARQRAKGDNTATDTRGSILIAPQRASTCASVAPHTQYSIDRTTGTDETENTITSDAGAQAGWQAGADLGGLPEDSYGAACSGERA